MCGSTDHARLEETRLRAARLAAPTSVAARTSASSPWPELGTKAVESLAAPTAQKRNRLPWQSGRRFADALGELFEES
jgi:hypothetical protein